MTNVDNRPDLDDIEEDAEFEEALRAQTRRRRVIVAAVLGFAVAALVGPRNESVSFYGRVAPARWARVRSEVPGVVREVKRRTGDAVQEGEIIAVLDADQQHDAVEAARLALTRERQKLADLELRLRQNAILRQGSNTAVEQAVRRAEAAEHIEDARLAQLDPASASVIDTLHTFTIKARGQVAVDARSAPPFAGEELLRAADVSMAHYAQRAEDVAEHVESVVGTEAGRELRARLENVRFSFGLARSSLLEIALKHEYVGKGLLAPVELRGLVNQLERETRDVAQSFDDFAAAARGWKGSPAERREWVRSAEEKRQLLANETDRVEAERETVASSIAQAQLAVRAAQRNEGKTAIHAPIGGTLAENTLAELDGVMANASVGVIEDSDRLVLKIRAADADLPRLAEGQTVNARVNGRAVRGVVTWKVPRVGQEVRDQEWNVLVRVDGDVDGVEPGSKVDGAVLVGRRSLLSRLLDRRNGDTAAATGVAFVDDPTEQRAFGTTGQLAAMGSSLRPETDAADVSEDTGAD